MTTVLVRYGEIALKSERVRRRFEAMLAKNLKLALQGLDFKLGRERGRFFVQTSSPEEVLVRLSKVPGVVSVSPSVKAQADIEAIAGVAVKEARTILSPGKSFAVRVKRIGKHPFSSQELSRAVGARILKEIKGASVDLSAPEVEISIEVRGKNAYVFIETKLGIGGLPLGSQGKAVAPFFGTLSELVATFLMMKRGVRVYPLYLDQGGEKLTSVQALARKLAEFDPKLELWRVPFRPIATAVEQGPPKLAPLLNSRAALRLGEALAGRSGAEALVTSETLEQVNLKSLAIVDQACKLPVFRPLVGMKRSEVEELARKIEAPRIAFPPLLKIPSPKLEEVLEAEEKLGLRGLVDQASREARRLNFR